MTGGHERTPAEKPIVALVAALARNRVIGREQRLPWHLPEDLRHFKRLTMGNPVIMGHRTFAAIGRPLAGRLNIVLSRDRSLVLQGCSVAHSIEGALARARPAQRVSIIGGEQIYALALPLADRLELTEIDAEYPGDARFPEFDRSEWSEQSRDSRLTREAAPVRYAFVEYVRAPTSSRRGTPDVHPV